MCNLEEVTFLRTLVVRGERKISYIGKTLDIFVVLPLAFREDVIMTIRKKHPRTLLTWIPRYVDHAKPNMSTIRLHRPDTGFLDEVQPSWVAVHSTEGTSSQRRQCYRVHLRST